MNRQLRRALRSVYADGVRRAAAAALGRHTMALGTSITRREDIPWEIRPDGTHAWIEFRHPGWLGLQDARDVRLRSSLRAMRETREAAGAEILDQLDKARKAQAEEAEPETETPLTAADVLGEFDVRTLLERGIAAWSYDAPCDPAHIGTLDEATATWAALWIAALARSAFRPLAPEWEERADGSVAVRPGTLPKSTPPTSPSTASSTVTATGTDGPMAPPASGY